MATKKQTTKKGFDWKIDVNLDKNIKRVKDATKDVNDFVLETSEDIVEGSI